jgi:predicted outer membrane repeat protein
MQSLVRLLLAALLLLLAASISQPRTYGQTDEAASRFASGISACQAPIAPVPLDNPTVVTDCTQAGLQAALDQGGHISFSCGSDPVTIPISSPLQTSATVDTVIDGGGLVTLDGQNSTRILEKPFTPGAENEPNGNDLTIQNMRFINALAPAASENRDGNARGGAITAVSPGTRLHIINSTFSNNRTTSITDEDNQGGAIYSANIFETVIVGSVFENNVAGNGGAFGGIATGLIVYNSRFTANQAADDSSGGIVRGHGGALHLDGVTNTFNAQSNRVVDVCGSEFVDNTAVRGGGAIKVTVSDNKGTKTTYQYSTFRNNRLVSVPPTEGHGGAIYHIEDDFDGGTSEDNIEITGSTFEGNYSYKQGGAAWILVRGNGRIVNSTFTQNEASEAGSNRVGQGGALIISRGTISVLNATFAENFATFQGGAIFAGGSSEVTLFNTLFYRNRLDPSHTDPATSEYQGYHTNRELTNGGNNLQFPRTKEPDFDNDINNLITEPAESILFADPLLESLGNNGGPTQTRALQAGSPAIDAARSEVCPAIDQRGVARPQGGGCDIGAFEFGGAAPDPTDPTATPAPDPTDPTATPAPPAGLTISGLSPGLVLAGGDSFTLTITGSGFSESSVIRLDGTDQETTFVSATQLTTQIDAAAIADTGSIAVTVYDPNSGGNTTETTAVNLTIVATLNRVFLPVVQAN